MGLYDERGRHHPCGATIASGSRCDEHRRAIVRARQASRPRFEVRIYGSVEWQRLRAAVVDAADRCAWCGTSRLIAPLTADHVASVRDRPDLALSPSNVVAACRSCQNRRIRRPDPATWQLRERTPRRW